MEVDRLEDVMSYYHFGIVPLYCLAVMAAVLFAGSLKKKALWGYAVSAAVLVIFACVSHYFFLGVLADNQAAIGSWTLQTHILAGISLLELILLAGKRFRGK